MRLQRNTRYHSDKPTRYYSHRQEKQVAKELGGTLQPNSGATLFRKGDVTTDKFLLEMKTKTTDSQQMSIKKEWLEKNERESLFIGKPYSALCFNFGPSDTKNYYIIDEHLFRILNEYLQSGGE